MKKIVCLVLSFIMIFSLSSVPSYAQTGAVVTYISDNITEKQIEGLTVGEVYYPELLPSKIPEDMSFVGWKDEQGNLIGKDGFTLDTTNDLYAVYTDKYIIEKEASISSLNTKNKHIFLPYVYDNVYYPSVKYELNGGYGPKEEVFEGEDAPYTRFVSGQHNGRGATLFFDENGIALTGRWNATYEITFKYRIPSIASNIHIQTVFGIKKENAQSISSDGIKDNILTVGRTSELTSRWNSDISGGAHEYWFSKDGNADEYNILSEGFNDWRSITFTVNTGEENADYLSVFGVYVNVGGGYNSSVVEIKNITVTDKYNARVKYVVDGETFGVVENIEAGSVYYIDRAPENTDTHYFAGWYLDKDFTNQARSCFIAEGSTVLYAKMKEYKDSLTVSSSAVTGEGWEAYKHSLRENKWWCYRILVGAYGIKNGKYGDLIDEGQAHRHYGSEANGNTAVADETGLKHETRDRNNTIWYSYDKGDYILRDENGEAFIVKPDAAYKVTLTYTFDNSLNPNGTAECFIGVGLSSEALMYSGEMKLNDLGEEPVLPEEFSTYGLDDVNDAVFYNETEKIALTPTDSDKQVSFVVVTPSLETFTENGLLQVMSISDKLGNKCTVKWKSVTVEQISAVENGGVSMLKTNNKSATQALRYYFSYQSTDGNDFVLGNSSFKVVSRGILLAKGRMDNKNIKRADADGKYIVDLNTDEPYKCWSAKTLENGNEQLLFSAYISGIASENGDYNSSDSFYARGYAVVDINGTEYTFYSNPSCYTVKEVAKLQKYHNEGEYKVMTEGGRELVWNLEFETETDTSQLSSKLNTTVETMSPDRKTLFMSSKKDNYFLDSGELVLRITKNEENNTYTTASCLTTADRMAFKYGYVEMRAKVPYKRSVWPSFWMQPDKKLKESALYNGEIDIFEVFGSGRTVTFNLHKWYNDYAGTDVIGNRGNYIGNLNYSFANSSISNDYHIYGFEWTPDYMKVYIDGYCYYQVSIKEEDDYSLEHPGMDCFRDYYYLCWNNWLYESEVTDGSLAAPVDYRIDYVRLYQNPEKEFIHIY